MGFRTYKIPIQAINLPFERIGPPAYAPPAYTYVQGTNRDWAQVAFDPDDDQTIFIAFPMPADYVGGTRRIRLKWKSVSAVGNVRWRVVHYPVGDSDVWDDTFSSPDVAVSAAPTVGDIKVETITITTSPAWGSNDEVWIGIQREATHASDTHIEDALLVGIDVQLSAPGPQYVSVNFATNTGDIASLSAGAPLSPDGTVVTAGDLVLVHEQTATDENGLYTVVTPGTGVDGVWERAALADEGDELVSGTLVYISEGSSWAQSRFTLTTPGPIIVGTTGLTFTPEEAVVRTDATSTEVIAPIAFTAGTIIWSSNINMRDHSELAMWFNPTALGANTVVDIYVQWSDDGATIPFDDDNGVQQTDVTISSTTGIFNPKDYLARLTTAGSELVANAIKHMAYPKKGGYARVGIEGNNTSGSFSVRTQRLA
jgi:hypothetical protein